MPSILSDWLAGWLADKLDATCCQSAGFTFHDEFIYTPRSGTAALLSVHRVPCSMCAVRVLLRVIVFMLMVVCMIMCTTQWRCTH